MPGRSDGRKRGRKEEHKHKLKKKQESDPNANREVQQQNTAVGAFEAGNSSLVKPHSYLKDLVDPWKSESDHSNQSHIGIQQPGSGFVFSFLYRLALHDV